MTTKPSRRTLLKTAGAAALGVRAAYGASPIVAAAQTRPHFEGKDTPKICLEAGLGAPAGASPDEAAEAAGRRIRQLGVDPVIAGGPRIPVSYTHLTLPTAI